MKSTLLIPISVLLFATMIFGSLTSGAWFSDAHNGISYILSSGSLDLEITGGPLSATNLQPGPEYTQLGAFCNRNIGTTDLKYRGLFESTAPLSNNLLNYVTMKVEIKDGWDWVTVNEIYGNATNMVERLVTYFKFPGQDPITINQYIVEGTLAPNQETCYRLSVMLDPATPDEAQGQSIHFVLDMMATQIANPGWE